jgi:hypothetical protein
LSVPLARRPGWGQAEPLAVGPQEAAAAGLGAPPGERQLAPPPDRGVGSAVVRLAARAAAAAVLLRLGVAVAVVLRLGVQAVVVVVLVVQRLGAQAAAAVVVLRLVARAGVVVLRLVARAAVVAAVVRRPVVQQVAGQGAPRRQKVPGKG